MNHTTINFSSNNKQGWSTGIVNQLEQVSKYQNPAITDFDDHFSKHIHFITLVNHVPVSRQMNEFNLVYFKTCRILLGNKLHTKRQKQPLGYAFLDFGGSKAFKIQSDRPKSPRQIAFESKSSGFIPLQHWPRPHIHAVMLVPAAINDKFVETFKAIASVHRANEQIEIDRFDPNKGSLTNLLTYSMKGFFKIPTTEKDHDIAWQAFPR